LRETFLRRFENGGDGLCESALVLQANHIPLAEHGSSLPKSRTGCSFFAAEAYEERLSRQIRV